MAESHVLCPYCGKTIANSEKMARHLARECPVVGTQEQIRQTGEAHGDDPRQGRRSK